MIDLRPPLAVLASRMPWLVIEARAAQVFYRYSRAGVAMPDLAISVDRCSVWPLQATPDGPACCCTS